MVKSDHALADSMADSIDFCVRDEPVRCSCAIVRSSAPRPMTRARSICFCSDLVMFMLYFRCHGDVAMVDSVTNKVTA